MPAFYFGYVILAVAIVAKSVKGFGQANIIGCEHATLSRALRHIPMGIGQLHYPEHDHREWNFDVPQFDPF